MGWNALYVCLHAFSLRRESPNPDPERRTPHFWGGFVTKNVVIYDELCKQMIKPHNPKIGMWKENVL
jgi:hypothetical protein